jgi:hypothetical protein
MRGGRGRPADGKACSFMARRGSLAIRLTFPALLTLKQQGY